MIIHNNQNRDKLKEDLQKFAQTSEHILRTFDVINDENEVTLMTNFTFAFNVF